MWIEQGNSLSIGWQPDAKRSARTPPDRGRQRPLGPGEERLGCHPAPERGAVREQELASLEVRRGAHARNSESPKETLVRTSCAPVSASPERFLAVSDGEGRTEALGLRLPDSLLRRADKIIE